MTKTINFKGIMVDVPTAISILEKDNYVGYGGILYGTFVEQFDALDNQWFVLEMSESDPTNSGYFRRGFDTVEEALNDYFTEIVNRREVISVNGIPVIIPAKEIEYNSDTGKTHFLTSWRGAGHTRTKLKPNRIYAVSNGRVVGSWKEV